MLANIFGQVHAGLFNRTSWKLELRINVFNRFLPRAALCRISKCSTFLCCGLRVPGWTYGHMDIPYPGVPRGPVPVPGFLIQKSVLPSKNQFFYPGKIFLHILIF